ncbi:MAG: hypothetical protein II244_01550 [Clostridia bacterium]|nr:hypothetical protein [Clostridia bacterium]
MNIFKKLALINKVNKAIKQAKKIAEDNSQLAIDLEKALLNIKADFEVLSGLLPSLKGVYQDVKALLYIK